MKVWLTILSLVAIIPISAQMNNAKMENILAEKVDSIIGIQGRWQITYQQMEMIVITDETNDRMRIMTPIIETENLDKDILLDCLAANFHTALDVKYAITDDILWSVFIHPLSPLSKSELESAVDQVYYAAATFGTTYTSTPLIFGGNNDSQDKKPTPKLKKI